MSAAFTRCECVAVGAGERADVERVEYVERAEHRVADVSTHHFVFMLEVADPATLNVEY